MERVRFPLFFLFPPSPLLFRAVIIERRVIGRGRSETADLLIRESLGVTSAEKSADFSTLREFILITVHLLS